MLYTILVLTLSLAPSPEPSPLSPEAAEHHRRAMVFYDNGQLAPAFDEFQAAYASMPDARGDRAGREILLGSMRATLLEMHAMNGDAAPLCRLQAVLQAHIDALAAAHPDAPDMLELRSARARHDEGRTQLAAHGPEACAAPPPSTAAAGSTNIDKAPAPEPPADSTININPPTPRNHDVIPPRHLRIAGGVTFGLGAVLLGLMTYGIVGEAGHAGRVDEIDVGAEGRPLTQVEHDELITQRQAAQASRSLAIGTGVAAGVTVALGTTLFVLARRSARIQRWSLAPWWSPGGGGLTLRLPLGHTRRSTT